MNDSDWKMLCARALQAMEAAYAPYSRFSVGAALLGENGEIFTGVNVENASYGLTLCAERNAVAQSIAANCRSWRGLAIASQNPTPISPCGACRQVLREFADDLRIISVNAEGTLQLYSLAALLPDAFKLNQ